MDRHFIFIFIASDFLYNVIASQETGVTPICNTKWFPLNNSRWQRDNEYSGIWRVKSDIHMLNCIGIWLHDWKLQK